MLRLVKLTHEATGILNSHNSEKPNMNSVIIQQGMGIGN